MTTYIIRRLLLGVIVLVLVTVLIFLLMHMLPGDPLLLYIGMEVNNYTKEQLDVLRVEYNLDKPWVTQYFLWIGGILRGDLGKSIAYQMDLSTMIAQRLPVTINLGVLAFIVSATFGITLGTICAIRRGKWPDTFFSVIANLGITLPNFWVGILLIYALAYKLNLLPTYGYTSPFEDLRMNLKMLIMPVFCLSVFGVAAVTRQTRSSILEVTEQDYVRTAWAKGLRERVIVIRHILKNGLIPVVTTLGMQVSILFGGSVLIETVFNIPGMGRMMRDGIMAMDYQVVQGGVLIIAVMIILANIIVDIAYGWLDPRIRYN
jgi:peptide/nickel transport system permease protein